VAAAIERDHVLIAVANLADAASAFAENHGLISIEGGRLRAGRCDPLTSTRRREGLA
jgi:hypothetical protein